MTVGETALGIALVCLSIATTILAIRQAKHESSFHSAQTLFTMLIVRTSVLEKKLQDLEQKEHTNVK